MPRHCVGWQLVKEATACLQSPRPPTVTVYRFGNRLQLLLWGLLKGSGAFSTGNTDGESFGMLHVGGIGDKSELKSSYCHRKWIQIKHCKQNSGEDGAVSLPLVADNPMAGTEAQWSVAQFLPTMSYSWVYQKDSIISQWWMRSKEERGGLY